MRRSWFLPVLAFVIAGAMVLARLGDLPLLAPDEGRNAEVAREMMGSHAWLIPTYDGVVYLDKPAFYFKLVALSLSVFGESEWAARLPSALFGVALLAVVFAFCRRAYDARTAALAVLVVATSPLWFSFSRTVIFDMPLAFFVSASILAAYLAEETADRPRRIWYLLASAAAGLATLVKGPVGFIVPTLVTLIFQKLDGRQGVPWRVLSPLNLLVFFGIVLPWFFGVAHYRADFPYYGLVEESFQRFTTPSFQRTGPFYYYGPVIFGLFFAWSVLLPESMVAAWRARHRWSSADRLFIVWAAVVVLFFSISQSKLPGYILTAIVALGGLTARTFAYALVNPNGRAARLVLRGTVGLVLLSAILAALLGSAAVHPGTLENLGRIRSPDVQSFRPFFVPMIGTLLAVTTTGLVARWTRDVRVAFASFLVFPILVLAMDFGGIRSYADRHSGRSLATRLAGLPPSTEIACLQCLPNGVPFYLKRYVTVLTTDGGELTSNYITFTLQGSIHWPKTVVPLWQTERWLQGRDHDVLLLATGGTRSRLEALAASRGVAVQELDHDWWSTRIPAWERH